MLVYLPETEFIIPYTVDILRLFFVLNRVRGFEQSMKTPEPKLVSSVKLFAPPPPDPNPCSLAFVLLSYDDFHSHG